MARQKISCEDCPVLRLVEAGSGIVDAMRHALPRDVGEHVLNARREMLLAVRSVIDHKLGKIEEAKAKKKAKKATRIKVK